MPRTSAGMTAEQKAELREQTAVNDLAAEIFEKIKEARGRMDMNKTDFAEFIGISRSQFTKWLNGKVSEASFETLIRAAHRCGIKLEVTK